MLKYLNYFVNNAKYLFKHFKYNALCICKFENEGTLLRKIHY